MTFCFAVAVKQEKGILSFRLFFSQKPIGSV